MGKVIAVDGPAGAGKSTLSRLLAGRLGYRYLDTGAMYRAITLLAIREGIDLDDPEGLTDLARNADLQFLPSDRAGVSPVLVNGHDVSREIRQPAVDRGVSLVARIRGVREEMVQIQRRLAEAGEIVIDGRDIGTRVVPDADLKFYITASLEERAKRRYQELQQRKQSLDFEQVKAELRRRDRLDKEREESPLIKADEAILIDTTEYTIEELLERVLKIVRGENNG